MRNDPIDVLLSTDAGDVLPVVIRQVRVVGRTVRVALQTDGSVWSRFRHEGSFHLSRSTVPPDAPDFAADEMVTVDVQLAPALAPGLLAADPTGSLVWSLLAAPDPSGLRHSAAWYARSCTVPLGPDGMARAGTEPGPDETVHTGYRTVWGARPDIDELPLVGYLAEHVDRRAWTVTPVDGIPGFTWGLTGTHTSWTATVLVDEHAGRCTAYSVLSDVVAPDRRAEALERLNELNLRYPGGSWELTELGSVRMRSTAEITGWGDPGATIAITVDRHLDAFDELVVEVVHLVR